MNTQKKLYLLPHRCQLIGWILVGVSLVFAIGSLLFIKGQDDRETYAGLGIIISFIPSCIPLIPGLTRNLSIFVNFICKYVNYTLLL